MMTEAASATALEVRGNPALRWAFLFALASTACDALLFAGQHAERLLVWLSVLFAFGALAFLLWSLKLFFAEGLGKGRRIRSSLLALVSALLIAVNLFGFFHARAVPPSAGAPQVGQKIPDFTLPDIHNQPVSLTALFAPATNAPPKAVLLVFYRGYW
ncbi:MAG TPA: hypothetical protein VFJ47_09300 [Terriglobales bacterium]|nr:hypothetical protein [Terriglobales bacterium]